VRAAAVCEYCKSTTDRKDKRRLPPDKRSGEGKKYVEYKAGGVGPSTLCHGEEDV